MEDVGMLAVAVAVAGCAQGAARPEPEAAGREGPRVREGLTEVEGGRVWWRVVGDGDGTPLVLLHGGPGHPHDYLEPLEALADERPVIFYDQLGCGRSDRPADPDLWRIDRFVEELHTLREALGLTKMHVLGHSWGSMLATDYLLAHGAGVDGVILDSPVLSMRRFLVDANALRAQLPEEVRAVIDRSEAAGTYDTDEFKAAYMEYIKRHLLRIDPFPASVMRTLEGAGDPVYASMWGPSEFLVTGSLGSYEREDRLGEIRARSLLLSGRHDEVTPATAAAYQARLPGSRLVVFENGSHLKHLEETDRYLEVVREFLREADGG